MLVVGGVGRVRGGGRVQACNLCRGQPVHATTRGEALCQPRLAVHMHVVMLPDRLTVHMHVSPAPRMSRVWVTLNLSLT